MVSVGTTLGQSLVKHCKLTIIKKIKVNVDYYYHYCKVCYNNVNNHKSIATFILCKQRTCLLEFDTEDDITCLFCSKKCKSLSMLSYYMTPICPRNTKVDFLTFVSIYNEGYGFGDVFRKFFRWIVPIIKKNATPVLQNVGNEIVKSA